MTFLSVSLSPNEDLHYDNMGREDGFSIVISLGCTIPATPEH